MLFRRRCAPNRVFGIAFRALSIANIASNKGIPDCCSGPLKEKTTPAVSFRGRSSTCLRGKARQNDSSRYISIPAILLRHRAAR